MRLILFSLQAIYQKALQIIENFFPDGDQVSNFYLLFCRVGVHTYEVKTKKADFFVDLTKLKVQFSFFRPEFRNSSFC